MKKLMIALLLPCPLLAQQDTITSDPPFVRIQSQERVEKQFPHNRNNIVVNDDDTTKQNNKSFVRIVSISGYSGGDFYRDGYEDRTIFQKAVPQSSLAFADVSGYTNYSGWFPFMQASVTAGMNVNMHLRCQKKFGELRAGISHTTMGVAGQSYTLQTTTPMDTTVLPGGQWLISDSVHYSSYEYQWNSDVLQLNLGWIVRSDPRRWVSAYTGVGFNAGFGYNGVISMSHSHTSYYHHHTTQYGASYSTNYENIISVQEMYKAPGFTTISAYVPIGWNIRLGNRRNFFSHVALFGEYNGAIMFLNTSVGVSKIRTVSSMFGGVRWYVHAPGKPQKFGRVRHERRNKDGNSGSHD